jgi:hypothetical protein
VIRWTVLSVLVVACALLPAGAGLAASASDRLDRFRALAATRLTLADVADRERAAEAYREVLALLDEEIVDSLASGSFFASPAFLQDRLDGFADAWGGASLRLTRIGALTVGAFHLGDGGGAGSVRVYGAPRGEAQLLTALQRTARPSVHTLSPGPAGTAQFAVVWEGEPTGRGTRPFRLDLMRQRGDEVAVAWSTADVAPEGLTVRDYRVRGNEVRVRYELHYPGWSPGCDQQTEQEDVFRLAADGSAFTRVSRLQYNAWHQVLHRAVAGLLEALAAGNHQAVAALVPDPRLRERLPSALALEPACDAADGPNPSAVSVAASAGEQGPWTLTFRRRGGTWRLGTAAPVLQ